MRRFGLGLAAIAALGVGIRVGWVLAGSWEPGGLALDSLFYHDLANLLAQGHGFVSPIEHAAGRELPTADKPPLFPLLLAAFSKLGVTGIEGHRLVGCLLGGMSIGLAGLLGRRLADERTGLIAGAIAAVYPFFVSLDGGLLTESLYGPLLLASLLASLWLADRPTSLRAVATGGAIGLAALTRPEALLLLPLLVLPLMRGPARARLPHFGLACLAAVIVLAPWTIRNLAAFHRFVPLSSQAGVTIGGANCPATYGGRDLGFWRFACIPRSVLRIDDEAERADAARRLGVEYARDHVGRLPVVVAARLARTWELYGTSANAYPGGLPAPRAIRLGIYYLLTTVALVGLVLMAGRRVLLFLAPAAIAFLVTVVGFGYARFRYATDLALTIPAAAALSHGLGLLAGRRRRSGSPPTPVPRG